MKFLDYDLKYNLGVTRDLKREFRMDFNKLIQKDMDIDDLIKFIFTATKDNDMNLREFTDYVYDSGVGLMDLQETYMDLVVKIMYPGDSVEEGKRKLQEKQQDQI